MLSTVVGLPKLDILAYMELVYCGLLIHLFIFSVKVVSLLMEDLWMSTITRKGRCCSGAQTKGKNLTTKWKGKKEKKKIFCTILESGFHCANCRALVDTPFL